jgi:hypothetical protein
VMAVLRAGLQLMGARANDDRALEACAEPAWKKSAGICD